MRIGVFPGSFNPPTHAHVAIALAGGERLGVDRVVLCVSTDALAKPHKVGPDFATRIEILRRLTDEHPQLDLLVTDARLIADICRETSADGLIVGADKWTQIHQSQWYPDDTTRDELLANLPRTVVATRVGFVIDPIVDDENVLVLDQVLAQYSSTGARTTNPEWMVAHAAQHAADAGGWR
jgi:nicotinic acid mononucleotide adenylyltransferase